jgi:hypothetical protein
MAGHPSSKPCPKSSGCTLGLGHSGTCNDWQPCPTTGCSQFKGHPGACDAKE